MKKILAVSLLAVACTWCSPILAKELGTTPDGNLLLFVNDENNFNEDGSFKFDNVIVDQIVYRVIFKNLDTNVTTTIDYVRPDNHPSSEVILPVTGENRLSVEGDYKVRIKVINYLAETGEEWTAPDDALAEFTLSYIEPTPTPTPSPTPVPTPTPIPVFIPLPLEEGNVKAETDFNETTFSNLGIDGLERLLEPTK